MRLAPVFGDILPRAEPDPVVPAHVIEKFDEPDGACRPADQAVMQSDAHDFRPVEAFLVEHVEAVDHVACEILGGAEAVVVVAVVVRFIGVGDHEVWRAGRLDPIRQFIVERVTVVEKPAMFGEQPLIQPTGALPVIALMLSTAKRICSRSVASLTD